MIVYVPDEEMLPQDLVDYDSLPGPDRAEELAAVGPDLGDLLTDAPTARSARPTGFTSMPELADREGHFLLALQAAVPLWIAKHNHDGPPRFGTKPLVDMIGGRGDNATFGSKRKLEARNAFNAIAEGLALLARQPGGVDFCGQHWCTDHRVCEAAS